MTDFVDVGYCIHEKKDFCYLDEAKKAVFTTDMKRVLLKAILTLHWL